MENIRFTLSAEDCETIFEALCEQEPEIADSQLTDMFMVLTKMDTDVDLETVTGLDQEIGALADRVSNILEEIGDTSDLEQVPLDDEDDDIDAWEQWIVKTKVELYGDLEVFTTYPLMVGKGTQIDTLHGSLDAPDTVDFPVQAKSVPSDDFDDSGWCIESFPSADEIKKTWQEPVVKEDGREPPYTGTN